MDPTTCCADTRRMGIQATISGPLSSTATTSSSKSSSYFSTSSLISSYTFSPPSPTSFSPSSSQSPEPQNNSVKLGASIGGVLALVIVIAITLFILRLRQRRLTDKDRNGLELPGNQSGPIPVQTTLQEMPAEESRMPITYYELAAKADGRLDG